MSTHTYTYTYTHRSTADRPELTQHPRDLPPGLRGVLLTGRGLRAPGGAAGALGGGLSVQRARRPAAAVDGGAVPGGVRGGAVGL